jgi:hypothetical protein
LNGILRARRVREQCQRQGGAEDADFLSHDTTFLRLRARKWRRIG